MGVKGDDILLAGVHEGTESPKKAAKEAKRTFAAGLDLLTLKQIKLPTFRGSLELCFDFSAAVYSASGAVSPDQP